MDDLGEHDVTGTVVAVDGPAGSGKSSVSRAAARRLGFDYQDTGAAYRAFAWFCLQSGVDVKNQEEIAEAVPGFSYTIGTEPDGYFVRVGSADVTEDIRTPPVTAIVSSIARVPEVREHLIGLFRGVIHNSARPGIITEGRDITTVVAPDADVRILLTAEPEVRAARRAAEVDGANHVDIAAQLNARDAKDSKVVDFMNAAPGVTTLDSTDLDFDQTVDAMVELVRAATHQ
ncbi:MAG: (d)CMP kinase [Actinomycetota bacterium]|nr:(d)CMP kinase [Actinomycetota bacterium]